MLPHQRRMQIASIVKKSGDMTVDQLAQKLQVSTSTIRRDLSLLDREGMLTRVRGGVIESDANPFAEVAAYAQEEKQRIARLASQIIPERATVILDIGTTGAALARELRGRDLVVITASLAVVDELRGSSQTELIVLGGVLRRSYCSLVGNITENALAQITADYAFLGTSGVRPDGMVLDSTGIEVPVKRGILEHSVNTYLLAAADKFPGSGLVDVTYLKNLTGLVTTAPRASLPKQSEKIEVIFA